MRTLVLVSGAPGAGKSTLAPPLAAHLGLPLLSKDFIKEALFDTLGSVDDNPLASSRRLGAAAMTLLWRLAAHCPAVMLEANFRSAPEYERDRVAELCPRPVEVYCRVPPELALRRYDERGTRPDHHEVHAGRTTSLDAIAEYQLPMNLGPVIEVDTSGFVDVAHVARLVQTALPPCPSRRRDG